MSESNGKVGHKGIRCREFVACLVAAVLVIVTIAWVMLRLVPNTFLIIVFILAGITGIIGIIGILIRRVMCTRDARSSSGEDSKDGNEIYPPEPGSEFKDWVIPLPDFRFHHEPYRGGDDYRDFIGRDALVQSFLDLLRHSRDRSGSYLVTGYRGVGKTSFVHKTLKDYAVGRQGPIPERRHPLADNTLVQDIYWRYLEITGSLALCWHRMLYRIQRRERVGRRSCSLLLRDLMGRWLPQRGARWCLSINSLGVMWLLFGPVDLGIDIFVVLVLLANHIRHNHGHLLARIRHHFFRWPWRPLVQVHVNLGYEIKEPKRVLFSLIALLRSQYESVTGYGSPAGLLRFVLIAALSLALAEEVYRRVNNTSAERFFQREILDIPRFFDGTSEELQRKIQSEKNSSGKEWNTILSNDLNSYCHNRGESNQLENDQESISIQKSFAALYCAMDNLGEQASQLFEKDPKVGWLGNICVDDRATRVVKTSALLFMPFYRKENEEKNEISKILGSYGKYQNQDSEKTHCAILGNDAKQGNNPNEIKVTPFQFFYYFAVLLASFLFFRALVDRLISPVRVLRKLDILYDRTVATESVDTGIGRRMSLFQIRRQRVFHPLDEREAESGLLEVLETNHNIPSPFIRPDIVFVFDELDKIEPGRDALDTGPIPLDLGISDAIRVRKAEVEALLGNLKNLITIAPCRFIFIAGREMMDANLADRGETRYLYGSLFDKVIYVPSFLTDASDGNEADISSMVEQYVCRRLMRPNLAKYLYRRQMEDEAVDSLTAAYKLGDGYGHWSLKTYYRYQQELHEDKNKTEHEDKDKTEKEKRARIEQRMEIVQFLQDFVYFLAYRSAGNPKKLTLLFEEFIHPIPGDLFVGTDKNRRQINPYHRHSPPVEFGVGRALCMGYQEQYRIQLISHFFIVFHGEQSRLIKRYGDKLSVSIFAILDYILKFHSEAFSPMDLERMPNVLDIHRAPALHGIIDGLLTRLLRPYLRRMSNGLFHYRFLEHFRSELLYISQFSEADLAAFNFSLDESIQIKQHYRLLLDEQRQGHKLSHAALALTPEKIPRTPHAFPYLHAILGDLHFLDKEYDQARIGYRNAIQYLEPSIQSLDTRSTNNRTEKTTTTTPEEIPDTPYPLQEDVTQILLYARLLLKLGLMEEHRGLYDRATSVYHQACRVVDHVMDGEYGPSFIRAHFEQINMLVQPHLCLAFVHTKRDLMRHTADQLMERRTRQLVEFTFHGGIGKSGKTTTPDLYTRLAENVDRLVREDDSENIGKNRKILLIESNGERSKIDHYYPIVMQMPDRLRIVARSYMRWAELLFWRSDFRGAIRRYVSGIRFLRKCLDLHGPDRFLSSGIGDEPRVYQVLEILGMALMGLGDAAMAFRLHEYYCSGGKGSRYAGQEGIATMKLPGVKNDPYQYNPKKGESHETTRARFHGGVNRLLHTCDTAWEMSRDTQVLRKTIDDTIQNALRYYALAAYAFRLSDNSADGRLALWKLSYALGMGLSYAKEDSLLDRDLSLENPEAMNWLFGEPAGEPENPAFKALDNPVQVVARGAFGWSYQAHHERLKSLFKENDEDDSKQGSSKKSVGNF
uniref:Uncharacterized protein n=1 Tax=Candidatus Kentrum sp. TC TaxID=2126339 RepID=A0A450Z0H8_9GAMM|nr:MAG: hypothetical protein BECKTC1821E_GA0114239_10806 [Candidatus Kentron sp. TC]